MTRVVRVNTGDGYFTKSPRRKGEKKRTIVVDEKRLNALE
jgi:hypothetical protein